MNFGMVILNQTITLYGKQHIRINTQRKYYIFLIFRN